MSEIDATDRRILVAIQAGLPLHPQPFRVVAAQLRLSEEEVIERVQRLVDGGGIRRIAVVPNHYALGYRANGMTVWDVADDAAEECGLTLSKLDFVSHCYLRPRYGTEWPYNLFAMVHGRTNDEAIKRYDSIYALIKNSCRARDILFSSAILKKTGLRMAENSGKERLANV